MFHLPVGNTTTYFALHTSTSESLNIQHIPSVSSVPPEVARLIVLASPFFRLSPKLNLKTNNKNTNGDMKEILWLCWINEQNTWKTVAKHTLIIQSCPLILT